MRETVSGALVLYWPRKKRYQRDGLYMRLTGLHGVSSSLGIRDEGLVFNDFGTVKR